VNVCFYREDNRHLHQQEIVPFLLLLCVFARFLLLDPDFKFPEEA